MTNNAETVASLALEVYTSPIRTFTSSAPPEGPGDDATWSPSSSTLIYGASEAILVDLPPTDSQVDALADWIEARNRNLTRVFVTHGHGDHWLGLARLAERFPGVRGLATSAVLARARFEATDPGISAYWAAIFPGEVPAGAKKMLPELLEGTTLDLEGNTLEVIAIGRADTAESTALYVPSLSAVMPGDLVYNEVHMMTAEAGPAELAEWIANLDKVAAFNPEMVEIGRASCRERV